MQVRTMADATVRLLAARQMRIAAEGATRTHTETFQTNLALGTSTINWLAVDGAVSRTALGQKKLCCTSGDKVASFLTFLQQSASVAQNRCCSVP